LQSVETKTFTVNAFLKATITKTFTVDAFLQDTFSKTFSADSILVAFDNGPWSETEDFNIGVNTYYKTFSVDAILQATGTKEFTVDSILQATGTKDFTVDAILKATSVKELTADAFLQGTLTKTFTSDALLQETGLTKEFTVDAILGYVGSKELTADAELVCGREFGDNWQRKMWFSDPYYWRSRQDGSNLIFEYIHKDNLSGDNWATNANATISTSGCCADFTVRGSQDGIPTTIHYTDGTDTWIAESNEDSATGWAWQNTTKVFDATESGDTFTKVNLASDRVAVNPVLWASAVFYDSSEGYYWVQAREQTTSGDITGWDAKVDVSSVTNTSFIYGNSVRSIGGQAEKADMIFAWKEGATLKSRYWDLNSFETEQTIATGSDFKAHFDLEHSEDSGSKHIHVVYVAADGTVEFRDRAVGDTGAWEAADTISDDVTGHSGVGIVEHGDGLFSVIWEHDNIIEFRIRDCDAGTWNPLLVSNAFEFNPTTAVAPTTTVAQIQTADSIPSWTDVVICWIGVDGAETCAEGFGVLISTVTKELTVDAILKGTLSKELTVDSILINRLTKDFTADVLLQATYTKTVTSDAILQKTQEKTFTLDAFLQLTGSKDFTVDALLQKTSTKTFSADSILVVTKTLDFTVDAILRIVGSKDFTVDSLLKGTLSKTLTADVLLHVPKVLELDAILEDRSLDALMKDRSIDTKIKDDVFTPETKNKELNAKLKSRSLSAIIRIND